MMVLVAVEILALVVAAAVWRSCWWLHLFRHHNGSNGAVFGVGSVAGVGSGSGIGGMVIAVVVVVMRLLVGMVAEAAEVAEAAWWWWLRW